VHKNALKVKLITKELFPLSSMTIARKGHGIYRIGIHVYVFGGRSNSKFNISSAERYNIRNDEWEQLPDMNQLMRYCTVARIATDLYIVGEVRAKNDKLVVYDTQNKVFTPMQVVLPIGNNFKIFADSQKRLWLLGQEKLFYLNEKRDISDQNIVKVDIQVPNLWFSGPPIYHDRCAYFAFSSVSHRSVYKLDFRKVKVKVVQNIEFESGSSGDLNAMVVGKKPQ
jgi:hypothetical protein